MKAYHFTLLGSVVCAYMIINYIHLTQATLALIANAYLSGYMIGKKYE